MIEAFQNAKLALEAFLADGRNFTTLDLAADMLTESFSEGGKVLACGNGGSACDAMHFCEELTGRFRKDRRALAAVSLTDVGHMSCVANDYGYDEVFARGVRALGKPGDVLVALSTSGNSANVVRAVEAATEIGMRTIGLLGRDGGKLAGTSDLEWIVPGVPVGAPTADRIQEIHMLVLHALVEAVERRLFGDS
ncbi:MAG: D-sedoheptulose 7-phosphate isomerase [Phycisphaera sp.]|nr:MAG: D-sedoheptulose 7-phosphate isomerase [Phycisphaera sp.]